MNFRKLLKHKYLYLMIFIAAISLDFITTPNAAEEGTFRYESEFDVISGATVKVGIVPSDYNELASPVSRSVNPSYDQVEDMVAKAIEVQGGFDWVIDKGDKVMLKVNLVGADSPSGEGENTDVRVVKALIKIIDEFTEGDVEIVVAEGTARNNDDPNSGSSVWANSGYRALLSDNYLDGINFRLLNLNQSVSDLVEVELGKEGVSAIQGTKYSVHWEELDADVFITVPVLKIHDTGITNALKLQVGSAPGCYYGYNKTKGTSFSNGLFHDVGHRRWTSEMIVDLCNVADIDFVVVDALMCLETYKTYKGDNQVRMNTIIAGVDPVAVDHVCTKLLGLNPDDIAHITLAEKVGLGTNDPDKIIVEGASIADVAKRVKKNQSENGKFGQSNRTWILSEPFDGTDISDDYIANEATFVPQPANNGWSEPVYFFDDRIDLYSYYEEETNIVTYAFTYFSAPKDQSAELWLGSHEGIYVYINGEAAYKSSSTKTYGDNDIGEKVKTIQIKKGENTLLVKTVNRFGDYSFALNICEPESNSLYSGNRVDGLKFYLKSATPVNDVARDENAFDIICYPNPVTDVLNIRCNLAKANLQNVNILDLNGRIIKTFIADEFRNGQISWNLKADNGSKLAAGQYICIVKANEHSVSKQFVVR